MIAPVVAAALGLAATWGSSPGARYPAQTQAVDPAIREASRRAVTDCAAGVEDGKVGAINRSWKSLCQRTPTVPGWDGYRSEKAHYSLTRKGEGFTLSSEIVVDAQPASLPKARKEFMLAQTAACLPVIQQYFDRYALRVEYGFRLKKPVEPATPPNLLTVTDKAGRSHSRNYFFRGLDVPMTLPGSTIKTDGGPAVTCVKRCQAFFAAGGASGCQDMCEPIRQREYCQMMLHEVGHLMGLPDEYADPSCPDQEFISSETYPWSAMAVPFFGLLDTPDILGSGHSIDTGYVEFFPRHLETITLPLCGE
ncbi:MAG: hypothetical protein IT285_09820 [Bdellovibrionales bacterium]|nr:hypothetical protein [Bdellovibrionales bacterium]